MKELDVLVSRYHDNRYACATPAEQATFLKLLNEVEDPDIWAWVMAHAEPPSEFASLIHELRRHA
ncbi:MAG: succinate dehydrogenase assembly factor 2 [Pseudomonadota bacterium]